MIMMMTICERCFQCCEIGMFSSNQDTPLDLMNLEISKFRRNPVSHPGLSSPGIAEAAREANAAPGEGRGTHLSSAIIELGGGYRAKDINA